MAGDFRSGERLIEASLAADLGVSRGPVREAIQVLAAEGLVTTSQRAGAAVVTFGSREAAEIYDLRLAIEPFALRLLLQRRQPYQLKALETRVELMARATRDADVHRVVREDLNFHAEICKLTGNRRLHAAFLQSAPILELMLRMDASFYPSADAVLSDHRELFDLFARGDVRPSESALRQHLSQAKKRIVGYLEGQEAGNDSGSR